MNRFVAYVIQNEVGKIYIGCTSDLVSRLACHNGQLPHSAKVYTAKHGGHWRVAHTEEFMDSKEAIRRERQLKSSRGRAFIRKFLQSSL